MGTRDTPAGAGPSARGLRVLTHVAGLLGDAHMPTAGRVTTGGGVHKPHPPSPNPLRGPQLTLIGLPEMSTSAPDLGPPHPRAFHRGDSAWEGSPLQVSLLFCKAPLGSPGPLGRELSLTGSGFPLEGRRGPRGLPLPHSPHPASLALAPLIPSVLSVNVPIVPTRRTQDALSAGSTPVSEARRIQAWVRRTVTLCWLNGWKALCP